MTRRRSRRGPPRCHDCNAPVVFFRNPATGKFRPFDPRPVAQGQQYPRPPWPVENNAWAWPLRDLIEDLMVRIPCSRDEAEEHARAMPWHLPHDCPNRPQEASP
jgi:hypothetical protein